MVSQKQTRENGRLGKGGREEGGCLGRKPSVHPKNGRGTISGPSKSEGKLTERSAKSLGKGKRGRKKRLRAPPRSMVGGEQTEEEE